MKFWSGIRSIRVVRALVSSQVTRIIEISKDGITNFSGTYEEYLRDEVNARASA